MTTDIAKRSSLASQNTLTDMSSKFGGRTPVRIYFLDNSSKIFLLDSMATSMDVIRMILEKFDVRDYENSLPYFALFESTNGVAIDGELNLDEKINNIVQKWKDAETSKFVFMIRLYMPAIWGLQHKDVVAMRFGKVPETINMQSHIESAEIIDPQLINFQYNQAVYNVITSQYPTTPELALELGSYHFLYKFGSFNEQRHEVGFLGNRIVEFIPYSQLRGTDLEEWEMRLISTLRDITSLQGNKRSLDPQRRYLETVWLRLSQYYGCTFYRCSQVQFTSMSTDIILGVHHQGLTLFDRSSNKAVLRQFHILELSRWGYKIGALFYFETKLDGKNFSSVEFNAKDGEAMSNLLTDYASAYVKEVNNEEDRVKQRTGVKLSSNERVASASPLHHVENEDEYHKEEEKGLPKTMSMPPPPQAVSSSTAKPAVAAAPGRGPPPGPPSGPPPSTAKVALTGAPPPPPPRRPTITSDGSDAGQPPLSTAVPVASNKPFAASSRSSAAGAIPPDPRMTRAATKIQALYRGYSLRNEWIREDSAILLQCVFRGFLARCRVLKIIEELFESGEYAYEEEGEGEEQYVPPQVSGGKVAAAAPPPVSSSKPPIRRLESI